MVSRLAKARAACFFLRLSNDTTYAQVVEW